MGITIIKTENLARICETLNHGIHKFAGAHPQSNRKFEHHFKARLIFAILQAAYKRAHNVNPLTQLFLSEAFFLSVLAKDNSK